MPPLAAPLAAALSLASLALAAPPAALPPSLPPLPRGRAAFVTVNASANASLFYWFFPAQSGRADAPLILWLQGGPGASGLLGLFKEMGPLALDGAARAVLRRHTWNEAYGLLFVDSPVGTGYSYTASDGGYARSERDVARDLYTLLQSFLRREPRLGCAPLFVAGESYGGHFVPSLCAHILARRAAAAAGELPIRLAGLAIGDGLTDPPTQVLAKPAQAEAFGLVGPRERVELQAMAENASSLARAGRFGEALAWREAMEEYVRSHSGATLYDVRRMGAYNFSDVEAWANDAANKAWLGVPPWVVHRTDAQVAVHLRNDTMRSYKHLFPALLDPAHGLRVLLYQGQFDWKDGTASNLAWISTIEWEGREEFAAAPRSIWRASDGEIGGYVQAARNLCEVVVAGAGHLTPMDQPLHAFDMIRGFIEGSLCTSPAERA